MSYNTITDYIQTMPLDNLTAFGATDEQIDTIAAKMTTWENGHLVERDDLDFWQVVEQVLEA